MRVKELFPDFKRNQMGYTSFEHLATSQKLIYACLGHAVKRSSEPSLEMACIFDGVTKVEMLNNDAFTDYVDVGFGFAYELLGEENSDQKNYIVFSNAQEIIKVTARSIQFEENGIIM